MRKFQSKFELYVEKREKKRALLAARRGQILNIDRACDRACLFVRRRQSAIVRNVSRAIRSYFGDTSYEKILELLEFPLSAQVLDSFEPFSLPFFISR